MVSKAAEEGNASVIPQHSLVRFVVRGGEGKGGGWT